MDTLAAAKELFLKYGGSHFHMDREEEYELYRSFGVSKAKEWAWAEEQEKEYIAQLNHESDAYEIQLLVSGLTHYLYNYFIPNLALEMFQAVSRKEALLDSFSKVLISERVLDAVRDSRATAEIVDAGRKLAARLLRGVMQNPITVAPAHTELDYLADVLKEDKIKLRAAADLKRCGHSWSGYLRRAFAPCKRL